jgi:RHS repeat-associated protein
LDPDGRTYCTADPTNVASWLSANPTGSFPYLCPSTPPTSVPTTATATATATGHMTTIFDPAGRTLSKTDQMGDTTSYTYDRTGHTLTTTDPRGQVTTNCYYWESGSGQCAAGAPSGGGSLDDLYSTTTPSTATDGSGETTTYSYYPGDEIHTSTTPAGTTTESYDADGNLVTKAPSNGHLEYTVAPTVSYTYNSDGSRASMTDGTGTTDYSYDAAGDQTEQQFTASGPGLVSTTVQDGYYSTGVLESVTYPPTSGSSDPTVNYTYDATGAMVSETDWLGNEVTFGHDQDGNETAQNNAVTDTNTSGTSSTAFSYDSADEPTSATSSVTCGTGSGSLTQSFLGSAGSRNPDGQLTEETDSFGGSCTGASTTDYYGYDPAGRVDYQGTSAETSPSQNNFAYDASGDPTTISTTGTSGSLTKYTQTFDNAGELETQAPAGGGTGVTYDYDTLGDQYEIQGASTTVNYGYDQLGEMVSYAQNYQSDNNDTTNYQYDGDGLEAASTVFKNTAADPGQSVTAISCASTTFCAIVDGGGNIATFNGTSWSTRTNIDSNGLLAVSCPTSTFCEAGDSSGYMVKYSYSGGSWTSSRTSVLSGKVIEGVSCASSSFCLAVDSGGKASLYNGSTWSNSTIDGTKVLTSVSCPSTSFCAAVDASGNVIRYSSGSWSSSSSIDGSAELTSISCTSSTFCAATDVTGNALVLSGSTWAKSAIDGSYEIDSVSCTSSSFCAATDLHGSILTYNGTAWSTPQAIDEIQGSAGVSCPSASACEAVFLDGAADNYSATITPAQLTWNSTGGLPLILNDSTNDYIYGPNNEPVEQINVTGSSPTATFLTFDPSNSSWLATNGTGQELAFWRFDAFGNLSEGTPDSPFGYAGQYTDNTSMNPSDLSNMRARWYQPTTGTFTTRDPDFSSTDTAYTYAGDDPVNGSDPSGKATVGICGSAAAAAGALLGFGGTGSLCLVHTMFAQADEWGVTETY